MLEKKKLVRDLSIWALCEISRRKKWKSGSTHAQMRWAPNPGALRRTCVSSVCVRVCVCVGGGGYSHLYIYMKIPQNNEIKIFWAPKKGLSLHMCENIRVLPQPHPASMLVHEATVCWSVPFIWASKGFVIELVCWSVWWDRENWSQDWWLFGVLMLTHR